MLAKNYLKSTCFALLTFLYLLKKSLSAAGHYPAKVLFLVLHYSLLDGVESRGLSGLSVTPLFTAPKRGFTAATQYTFVTSIHGTPSQQYQYHQSMPSSSSAMPMFTPGQHQQLLRMLDQATLVDKPGTAHMEGISPIHKADSLTWIVDIGASQHMLGPLVWETEGGW
ncbi:hypothetical protein AABB24_035689 [Solanum stoloniferum]|uniref:Uncharacterized protein n=1 Tax=Solanum stoloniferum TaxID=62892 RepID=A0ABD2R8Q6_9SOLN